MPSLRSLRLVLAAVLLTATAATAQLQILTLHYNSGYGSPSFPLVLPPTPGQLVQLPSSFNDEVTSMQWDLQPNTIVTLYEHSNGTGREYTITHDKPRQGGVSNVGSYYNDKFSSLRWRTVNPSSGWVRFYTNINKGGYHLTRYLSLSGSSDIELINEGYNDQVDSIEWSLPSNKTLMCHDEYPAGGKALPLIDSGQYLNLDNGLSGVYHDNLSTVKVLSGQFTSAYADRNRPIDQVCQLRSHNSHVNAEQGWLFWIQQNYSILKQLDYGVRGINIDVIEENGQLLMVHGSVSQTIAARAGLPPEPLGPQIQAIHSWLTAHPKEVIILEFQNDAGAALTTAMSNSVLAPMFYKPDGLHWPSINELVAMGKRVICFNTYSGGEQLYPWTWQVENGYSDMWTTTPRSESDDINSRNRSMFICNNISGTSTVTSWLGNSPNDYAPLLAHVNSFAQIPTLLQIDGVEMADHAGLEVCRFVNLARWQTPVPMAAASRFHGNCGGATTLSVITRPIMGQGFVVEGAPYHVTALGFSDTSFGGVSLPSSVPGVTWCSLRAAPDLLQLANGFGRSSFLLPNSAQALGAKLYLQGAELTGGLLPLTNGVAARVGF